MTKNVFGNSSHNNNGKKIETILFVQNPYLTTNYLESTSEEELDLKNQYKIKILPVSINISDAGSKNYVDNFFSNSSVIKNTSHIDLNDRSFTNARFIQVNQLPQIDSQETAKFYVDTTTDEPS